MADPALPVNVVRYGSEQPLAEQMILRAGPVSVMLENGDLRYVRLGDEVIVLRVYGAIRDRNWDTIEPRFTRYEVAKTRGGFKVSYDAECVGGDVDFRWTGTFAGDRDGTITCDFDGVAHSAFLRNRIGWCVLHPMTLAGLPAVAETPEGAVVGEFPEAIMPWQPFKDMRVLVHPTWNGGLVTIEFDGDLFEMEDQRNWTDASYKTYSTPLRLPYPVQLNSGDRIRQRVVIRVVPPVDAAAWKPATHVQVVVGGNAIGVMPSIGVGAASHGKPLDATTIDRLRGFGLAHLRSTVDCSREDWQDRLRLHDREASELGLGLEIEVIAQPEVSDLNELASALAKTEAPIARVLVFPVGSLTTTREVVEGLRAAFNRIGISLPVGGGSRAFFTELNRAETTIPWDALDVVGYPINPTVHAIDNLSVMETLAAQEVTVREAKRLSHNKPLAVGPVTLRMPFNPNATGPQAPTPDGTLPANVDPRQSSLAAASWTAGSIGRLARGGATSLTYFQTNGWRGLMERTDHALRVPGFASWPGMVFPLAEVIAELAPLARGEVLPFSAADEVAIDGCAVATGEKFTAVVANLRSEPVRARIQLPVSGTVALRILDEQRAILASTQPEEFRRSMKRRTVSDGMLSLTLPPYAIAFVRGTRV